MPTTTTYPACGPCCGAWYCVDTGSGCPGEAMFLTPADVADTGITKCSGPYATQADAEADCPPTEVTVSCCATTLPSTLFVTLTGFNDGLNPVCSCVNGTYALVYTTSMNGSGSAGWYGIHTTGCGLTHMALYCVGVGPFFWEFGIQVEAVPSGSFPATDCPDKGAATTPCNPLTFNFQHCTDASHTSYTGCGRYDCSVSE